MAALQCERRLWLEIHRPGLAQVSAATRAAFATGHEVGDVARTLYSATHGEGHLLEYDGGLGAALGRTERLLADPADTRPIYEATFQHEGILVRLDVLLRDPVGAHLIEVKSATSLKPEHLTDCAIQAWVARGAGLDFQRMSLAHIDNRFVYAGDGDYRGLLKEQDITSEVLARQAMVPQWLAAAQAAASGEREPDIAPGKRCVTPYECAFMQHCWPGGTAYPVQSLGGDRELLGSFVAAGYQDLRDVPSERLTRADHQRIQAVTRAGVPQLDPEVGEFVRGLGFPRYFLDFETIGPAVPLFAGTRPYEALPFQFSCHVLAADGQIEHRSHLDLKGTDPRRGCAEALLAALDDDGPVLVYTGYEQRVIAGLALRFPDLAPRLRLVSSRLVDLHPVTRRHFYHPDMQGSWSLKKILPVVAPDLSYGAGEIQDGNAASTAWFEARLLETSAERRAVVTSELTRYCALDTEGLLRLSRYLCAEGTGP
jgi:hypothetical protein